MKHSRLLTGRPKMKAMSKSFHIINLCNELFGVHPDIHEGLYEFSAVVNNTATLPKSEQLSEIVSHFLSIATTQISITNNLSDTVIINCDSTESDFSGYQEFLGKVDRDDEFRVSITVSKKRDSDHIPVFCLDSFLNWFVGSRFSEFLLHYQLLFENRNLIYFDLYDSQEFLVTKYAVFSNVDTHVSEASSDRQYTVDNVNIMSGFANRLEFSLLPYDFHIIASSFPEPVIKYFNKAETLMSIAHIASSSYIQKNILTAKIYGARSNEYAYNVDRDDIYSPLIFLVFDWIANSGNCIDKAEIARSVLALHCRYCDLIKIDDSIFSSIKSNFKLYSKSNVQQYLDLKKKIIDYTVSTSAEISTLASTLFDRLIKNILAIFTFLLSAFVGNILLKNPNYLSLSLEMATAAYFVIFASCLYMFVNWLEQKSKWNDISLMYNGIKEQYKDVLDEVDLTKILDNDRVFDDAEKKWRQSRRNGTIIWILLLLLALICIEALCPDLVLLHILRMIKHKGYDIIQILKAALGIGNP